MSEVREAILKAADSIEAEPELYQFTNLLVHTCDTPSCPLGWIAYHLGLTGPERLGSDGLGVYFSDTEVYARLGISNDVCFIELNEFDDTGDWVEDVEICARVLREYADKYHPAEG